MEFPPEVLEKAEAGKERLDIHIHYSPHGSRQDMAQAENLVRSRQFDIYAPETPYATPQIQAIWRKVAKGEPGAYGMVSEILKRHKAESELAGVAIFYSSRMPIIMPDITDKEAKKYDVDDLTDRQFFFEFDGFENDYQRTKEVVHKHAKNIYFRDHIIATKLPAQAMDLLESTPRLKDRENVRVLATLGSRHTLVSHLLKERGYRVSRSFNVIPQVFTPADVAARQVAFGRELSEEMYTDAFKQYILHFPLTTHFINNPENNSANFALSRKVVDMVSDDLARELYELLNEGDPRYKILGEQLIDAATTE